MADALVTINASSFAAAAKDVAAVRRQLASELRRGNREVATKVAGWARSEAQAGTPAQRRFAGAIRPRATQNVARLAINSGGGNGGANATFWGARRRTGWNARNANSRPQFPRWVGKSWAPGVSGQGPYVINPTVACHTPEIGNLYADAAGRAFARAFPN